MDAGKQPLFPACGTDANGAVSAACGAAMQSMCSLGYGNSANGGVMQSMLLNPTSNCSNWMTTLQTVAAASDSPPPGMSYLDAAMRTYCGGMGSLTEECGCLAFPIAAAAWCAASSVTCPNNPTADCAAIEFAQTMPNSNALDVIQFTTCNPYYCWLADCYQTPHSQLLPSDILAYQATNNCAGVCGQVIGSATDNIAPMPPGTFSPASITANVSGIVGGCGQANKPALLVAELDTWVWPANGVMAAPLFVTNDGDYAAQVQLASASVGMCSVEPSTAVIMGRSSQQFSVVCDQASVSAWYAASATFDPHANPNGPASLTINPLFAFEYADLANGGATVTTEPMGIFATIMPNSGPIVQHVTAIPPWFWLAVAGIALLVVLQLALLSASTRGVRKLLAQGGIAT